MFEDFVCHNFSIQCFPGSVVLKVWKDNYTYSELDSFHVLSFKAFISVFFHEVLPAIKAKRRLTTKCFQRTEVRLDPENGIRLITESLQVLLTLKEFYIFLHKCRMCLLKAFVVDFSSRQILLHIEQVMRKASEAESELLFQKLEKGHFVGDILDKFSSSSQNVMSPETVNEICYFYSDLLRILYTVIIIETTST